MSEFTTPEATTRKIESRARALSGDKGTSGTEEK